MKNANVLNDINIIPLASNTLIAENFGSKVSDTCFIKIKKKNPDRGFYPVLGIRSVLLNLYSYAC